MQREHDLASSGRKSATTHPRLAVTSRGDALTHYLTFALAEAYDLHASIDLELTPAQRLLVAASTFRPSRRTWVERYYKSGFAYRLRSRNAARGLRAVHDRVDITVQVHALFEQHVGAHVIYVDCTHRQTAKEWPEWNPLQGRALRGWYEREGRQYRRAAHVFAFSEPTARSLVDDYGVPSRRVSVVGGGVNFDNLPRVPDRSVRRHEPTILFIGNDFVRKGGELLLVAFAQVRREIPSAQLIIVGTAHRIAEQVGVQVLGRIADRQRIADLYAEADVFALPSFFDPYPLVLLEAMAYGLPCVATRTCGVPEIVLDGQTGLLIEAGDAKELAAALLGLLRDPARAAEIGLAARERVESRLLWQHVVGRMRPTLDLLVASADGEPNGRTANEDGLLRGRPNAET